jgi:hypothetical protein
VFHLFCLISCRFDEVPAFGYGEQIADFTERLCDGVEASGGWLCEQRLELGECHFNRIEIGTVGWQPCAFCPDQFFGSLALVERDIVEVRRARAAGALIESELVL